MANNKEIVFGTDVRTKMMKGINTVANTVEVTLGPKGRNVILEKADGLPVITKDGVSVAREITLEDKFENMGAQLLKDVASRANDEAGDGTTTATVLGREIARRGIKLVESGHDPIEVQRGMNMMLAFALEELDKMAKPCVDTASVANVAAISANNDILLGNLIAEAMEAVGHNGIITVEDGTTFKDTIEYTEGLDFARGYLAPQFINNAEKQSADMENPFILLVDHKVHVVKDILPCLEAAKSKNAPILIIAEDFSPEALQALVVNKMRGAIDVVCVKAPGIGETRKGILRDIAVAVGGKVVSNEIEDKPVFTEEHLGRSSKAVVTQGRTTIIEGEGDQQEIGAYIEELRGQAKAATHSNDADMFNHRIARLAGGVAIIKVGATSEVEMKEKKDRIEDALNATRAAVEEGIVVGGGHALYRIASLLEADDSVWKDLQGDMLYGASELLTAIRRPFRKIIDNTGASYQKVEVEVDNHEDAAYGYNSATAEYGNLLEMGVIDPVKVTKSSLKYAVSVAGTVLTTEAGVGIIPKENAFGMDMSMFG